MYTQRQLLNENIWRRFRDSPVGRTISQGGEIINQVASVVAPELTEPVKRGMDRFADARKKITRAGKSYNELGIQALLKAGLYPLPTPETAKIQWKRDEAEPEFEIGTIKVGRAEVVQSETNPNKTEYIKLHDYKSDKGQNYATLRLNRRTKDVHITKSPMSRNVSPLDLDNPRQRNQQQQTNQQQTQNNTP